MQLSLLVLIGHALWTLLLGSAVIFWRVWLVLRGKSRSNEFASGIQHGSDPYWRLNRAHINSAENLPILGAVVLTAAALGRAPLIENLAVVYLAARIVQSMAHISSNSEMIVNLRFSAHLVQYLCIALMCYRLLPYLVGALG